MKSSKMYIDLYLMSSITDNNQHITIHCKMYKNKIKTTQISKFFFIRNKFLLPTVAHLHVHLHHMLNFNNINYFMKIMAQMVYLTEQKAQHYSFELK